MNAMPNMLQTGTYSSVLHYLKAVQAAGTDRTEEVMQKMRELPVDDVFKMKFEKWPKGPRHVPLRSQEAGGESKGPWDYYKLRATIPAPNRHSGHWLSQDALWSRSRDGRDGKVTAAVAVEIRAVFNFTDEAAMAVRECRIWGTILRAVFSVRDRFAVRPGGWQAVAAWLRSCRSRPCRQYGTAISRCRGRRPSRCIRRPCESCQQSRNGQPYQGRICHLRL